MTITGVLTWIVFGIVIGAIARFLMPGRQEMSLLMTMALGIIGSFVGGAIASLFSPAPQGFVHPSGWIMSVLGALIVLFLYSRFKMAPRH